MWIQEGTFKCADLQNWILRICAYRRTFLNSGTILFVRSEYSRVLRPYVRKYLHYLLRGIEPIIIIMCNIEILGTATLSKKGRDRTSQHFRIISRSFLHRFTWFLGRSCFLIDPEVSLTLTTPNNGFSLLLRKSLLPDLLSLVAADWHVMWLRYGIEMVVHSISGGAEMVLEMLHFLGS